ncbi:interleukin-36 alpha-like protein [Cricetulus griseus]|nr:interleukin-36 alpha-like protein [Cricetulus griseus]
MYVGLREPPCCLVCTKQGEQPVLQLKLLVFSLHSLSLPSEGWDYKWDTVLVKLFGQLDTSKVHLRRGNFS